MRHFITTLFNLEYNQVQDLELSSVDDYTFVYLTLRKSTQICPNCKTKTSRVHDYRERSITHPILNDKNLVLIYNQRRFVCMNCLKRFAEKNPFASPGKRISRFTVLKVMKELKNPKITFSLAASNANISTTTAIKIFDNHAGITSGPFPTVLCIDEVYAVKYTQKIYACVLVDFESNQLYDLLESRKKACLISYFSKIDSDQRANVRYISMDMWDTYRDVCKLYFKNAKLCVDSFHVVKLVTHCFNQTRIRVMKSFPKDSNEYYLLKKYAFLLNKDYEKVNHNKRIHLGRYVSFIGTSNPTSTSLINAILSLDAELEIAYMLKDEYLDLNRNATNINVAAKLDHYIEDLVVYNITEFKPLAKTLKKWKEEIVNSFDRYNNRRISNGPIESVNSRIKSVKINGHGYNNFERFRKRALYSLRSDSKIKL